MTDPTTIEAAFLAAVEAAVPTIAATYSPAPVRIDKLPAVSMFFIGMPQQPDTTGWSIVQWVWGIEISVRLDDLVVAQKTLQDILPGIMSTVRLDPQLDGTCNWATLEDREEPPFKSTDDNSYVKRIYLRAETDESTL